MSDNPKKQKLDRRFVSLSQAWEIRYWTKALGVTSERLRAAVAAVGKSVVKVRLHLLTDEWASGEVLDDGGIMNVEGDSR